MTVNLWTRTFASALKPSVKPAIPAMMTSIQKLKTGEKLRPLRADLFAPRLAPIVVPKRRVLVEHPAQGVGILERLAVRALVLLVVGEQNRDALLDLIRRRERSLSAPDARALVHVDKGDG